MSRYRLRQSALVRRVSDSGYTSTLGSKAFTIPIYNKIYTLIKEIPKEVRTVQGSVATVHIPDYFSLRNGFQFKLVFMFDSDKEMSLEDTKELIKNVGDYLISRPVRNCSTVYTVDMFGIKFPRLFLEKQVQFSEYTPPRWVSV